MTTTQSLITIHANGKTYDVPSGTRLDAFVQDQGLLPSHVVVERNGRALPRAEIQNTVLEADDRLEILRIVAGG